MKKVFLAVLVGYFLNGCTPMVWDKAGASPQDYNQDSYACEKDSRQSGYFGYGLSGQINMQAFFDKCMVAHGWHKRAADAVGSSNVSPVAVDPDYNKKLEVAEQYCKKSLPKKSISDPVKYNNCVSKKLDAK